MPEPYQCRFGTYSLAGPEDERDLAALLRSAPEQGVVHTTLTRQPDFFAGANSLGKYAVVLARSPGGTPMLLFEMRECPVYVESKPTRVVFVGLLRVAQQFRWRVGLLEHAFLAMRGFSRKLGFADHFCSTIPLDNEPARRLFEAGLPRMPQYKVQGDVTVSVLAVKQGVSELVPPDEYEIRRAGPENIPEIAGLLASVGPAWGYSPALRAGDLERLFSAGQGFEIHDMLMLRHKGYAVGCIGVWDQRCVRQLHVSGYPVDSSVGRAFYNLWAGMTSKPRLPAPGSRFELTWLPFFCLMKNHQARAGALLDAAQRDAGAKGAAFCAVGMAAQNRLRPVLGNTILNIPIRIYQVIFPGSARAGTGGSFTPQPEMALL